MLSVAPVLPCAPPPPSGHHLVLFPVWGGHLELTALSAALQRPIRVHAVGMDTISLGEGGGGGGEGLNGGGRRALGKLQEDWGGGGG